ncbi:MAG: hypothetical protein WBD04_06010 [Candidatus Omnitrophota bacterium]
MIIDFAKKILNNNRGASLITAYVAIFAFMLLAIAVLQRASTEYSFANRHRLRTEAYYLAESGAEQVAYDLARKVANRESEPAGAQAIWADLNTSITDFLTPGYELVAGCQSMDLEQVYTDANGIVTNERHYKIVATITNDEENISAIVNLIVARKKTFTFQHAVFYAVDLELLPGRDMSLSGKIHCNNDIYIDANTDTLLTVDTEYLRTAGDIFNMRKDSGWEMPGIVLIKIKGTSNYEAMLTGGDIERLDSRRSDWSSESQNRWGGTVQSGVHGVTSLVAPEIGSIHPSGFYATQATVKVINGEVYENGVKLVEGTDIPVGTVATSTSFYNNREGKYVKMNDIDVDKLSGYEMVMQGDPPAPVRVQTYANHLPADGLVYSTRDDVEEAYQGGVRIKNGSTIDNAGGLILVTNLPGYIQGDFNSVEKKSAAMISDAANFLSNNWDDVNSTSDLGGRAASGTTVNAAFIAGIGETVGGVYGGGLENYPRLHEGWEGITLTIRGAFVSLWPSQIATGQWQWGEPQYTAPDRDWDFDTSFFDINNLPSYTPFAVEIESKAWWKG